MKMTVTHEKYDQPHRLNAAWRRGEPPGAAVPEIRERLQQHVEAQGVESFRKGAAVAALLTVRLTPEAGEKISLETESNLLKALNSWVAEWDGSGAVAARTRWIVPQRRTSRSRSAARRHAQAEQAAASMVLLVELIVAPVRPEVRDGRETRRVVSLNKAFGELAVATLGSEARARHAEALEVSCRAHLARILPELNIAPRQILAPQEPEVIRRRREKIEQEIAALKARGAEVPAFVEHVSEVLEAIEENVIYLDQNGKPAAKDNFRLSPPAKAHYVQHRATYDVVLRNPSFAPGMRLMLQIVLGHLAEDTPEAANTAAEPDAGQEAS